MITLHTLSEYAWPLVALVGWACAATAVLLFKIAVDDAAEAVKAAAHFEEEARKAKELAEINSNGMLIKFDKIMVDYATMKLPKIEIESATPKRNAKGQYVARG